MRIVQHRLTAVEKLNAAAAQEIALAKTSGAGSVLVTERKAAVEVVVGAEAVVDSHVPLVPVLATGYLERKILRLGIRGAVIRKRILSHDAHRGLIQLRRRNYVARKRGADNRTCGADTPRLRIVDGVAICREIAVSKT